MLSARRAIPPLNSPDVNNPYNPVARTAHWLHVLLLLGSFTLGFIMVDLATSPLKLQMFAWHKWTGVVIFALVGLRLAWRWQHPPPPLPASIPSWQREAARISHRLLYGLLFAVPLSGWLMSSAKGFQTVLFGVLPIPDLLDKNPPVGAALEEVHWLLNKLLLGLIALHVAAALKHYFIDRNEVLARMLPGLSSARTSR